VWVGRQAGIRPPPSFNKERKKEPKKETKKERKKVTKKERKTT
jgi:hypothetical protein